MSRPHDTQSADALLSRITHHGDGYDKLRRSLERQAEYTRTWLRRVLHDTHLQNMLYTAAHASTHGTATITDRDGCAAPVWAYDVATVLLDPEARYSPQMRKYFFDLCAGLAEDAASGSDSAILAELIAKQTEPVGDFKVLKKIANELFIEIP